MSAENPLLRLGPGPNAEQRTIIAQASVESPPTAEEMGQLKGLPLARGFLARYLDDAGATLEKAARVISEGMDANETKVFSHKGDVVYSEPLIDHPTRLSAAELNLRARGELREQQQTVNLFQGLTDEQLAQIAAGQLDPASLIDVGPRIQNPARGGPAHAQPPSPPPPAAT